MTQALRNYLAGIDGVENAIRTEKNPARRKALLKEQVDILQRIKVVLNGR